MSCTPDPRSARTAWAAAVWGVAVVLGWFLAPGEVGAVLHAAGAEAATTAETAMTTWKAVVLGLVEGLTEYVPVSSTGHLLVLSSLLGLGTTEEDIAAANTYAIAIQFGAILAVAGLFWPQLVDMVRGLFGRSTRGRHLLVITAIAFVPAAVVGLVFEEAIEDRLFGPWPIIAAWLVGGVLILVLEWSGRIPRHGEPEDPDRDPIFDITRRQALIVGIAQVAALWPGTSRSLATILGALLAGVGMVAAVKFSFILGFLVLTAASLYKVVADGGDLVEQFGILDPLVGLVFAFIAAVVAIKWMIAYLQRNSLAIFGWYRIGIGLVSIGLVLGGVL